MKRSWAGALVTSCLMHVCFVGTGAWLLAHAFAPRAPVIETVTLPVDLEPDMELPRVEAVTYGRSPRASTTPVEHPDEPVKPEGGKRAARPELPWSGHGGSRTSSAALNLSDRVSPLSLNRDTTTLADQSQLQRLATARARLSLDDRRATPSPMQLSFVATGPGTLLERRPPARFDPGRGSFLGGEASREGGAPGSPVPVGDSRDSDEPELGGERGARSRHALGVPSGTGAPSVRARIITARPPVKRARAAVPANGYGRPNDTVNSSHQVADAVRSLVHAGGLGPTTGEGPGGERATVPAPPGRDGQHGEGSRAAPSGEHEGPGLSLAADTGFGRYTQQLLEQIDWERAFPTWAVARGIGGLTVVALSVDQHGRVLSVSVVRPSGIDEFDRNLVSAIRRDGPYGVLPKALGSSLTVRIAFDATNPAVGRDGPGPGGRGGPSPSGD
jgi:TonB family protein